MLKLEVDPWENFPVLWANIGSRRRIRCAKTVPYAFNPLEIELCDLLTKTVSREHSTLCSTGLCTLGVH